MWRAGQGSFFLHMHVRFFQYHLLEEYLFPLSLFFTFPKFNWTHLCWSISELFILSHWSMYAHPFANFILCWLLYFLIVSLKTGWYGSSNFILCFQIFLAIQGLLTFHINFRFGSRDYFLEGFSYSFFFFFSLWHLCPFRLSILSWWVW